MSTQTLSNAELGAYIVFSTSLDEKLDDGSCILNTEGAECFSAGILGNDVYSLEDAVVNGVNFMERESLCYPVVRAWLA